MSPEAANVIIDELRAIGFKLVTWPENADDGKGDAKGPRERGWQKKHFEGPLLPGHRVGALLGVEIVPGRYLLDFDVDWAPGAQIAARLLPPTGFVFGRASKTVSHAFYTCPEPIPSMRFEDVDKTVVLELRCAKEDGSVGFQTMIPPSTWSKDGAREALEFRRRGEIAHFATAAEAIDAARLTAIAIVLARKFGHHGFGHNVRMPWAGHLLRAGVRPDDIISMGEAISVYCENTEVGDVRTSVESTAKNFAAGKKIRGGPTLARLLGDGGKATLARIDEWLGHGLDFVRTARGNPIPDHQENVRRALRLLEVELKYDTFAERATITIGTGQERVADDATLNALWLQIDRDYGFRPTKDFFHDVAIDVARENAWHPVRDWLDELKWDGVPRIDFWLRDFAGAEDSDYLQAVSAIVLVAAVRRARQPGAKYDEMLVLEGSQGVNKSSALRALCPKEDWFSDDLPLHVDAKQIIERTLGKWIIEASDLAGKRRADIEQLKATLSRQTDGPARLAYERQATERKRQFILIGSTNSMSYLTDMTGARRFWPVAIQTFNVKGIAAIKDQLWAEASAREKAGMSIRLPEALWPAAAGHQEERREADAWEDDIAEIIKTAELNSLGKRNLTAKEIWAALGVPMERRDRRGSLRISEIMQRAGFKSWKVKREGVLYSGYKEL
jgi:hypothetical protein